MKSTGTSAKAAAADCPIWNAVKLLYAKIGKIVVALPGPPPVVSQIASNELIVVIVEIIKTIKITGRIPGKETFLNLWTALQPSVAAASWSSFGTDCSAAKNIIVQKGKPFQIVARITDGIAQSELLKNAIGESITPICMRNTFKAPTSGL